MTFADSDEGRALRDSVAGYLGRHFPLSSARDCYDREVVGGRDSWAKFVDDLGLPGLVVPEEYGGVDAGFSALAVALEETGRVILSEPLLPSVLAAIVIKEVADEAARSEFLPRIATGELIGTIAAFSGSELRARPSNETVVLDGLAGHVVHGTAADLVVALAHDEQGEPVVAIVDATSHGLERKDLPTLDRTRPLAELRFRTVEARAAFSRPDPNRLNKAKALADLALSAEQLGGARSALEMAILYATTRVAFGRPIGGFQAIKHKLARAFIAVESASAVITSAAFAADTASPELILLASTAKARTSEAFVQAASENIQVHGGIGFTWEHDAHLFLKRARGSFELLGSPADRYLRVAEMAATGSK